jgi:hypothetical protein
MRTLGWVTGAVLLLAVGAPAQAAQIELLGYHEAANAAFVSVVGDIANGDSNRYLSVASVIRRQKPRANIVVSLNSGGGNVGEAVGLSLIFRLDGQTSTMVSAGQTCASACVLLFMSGKYKIVADRARVGVHSASSASGVESDRAYGNTVNMARILADMGVAADVIGRLVATAPGEIYWLTDDELRRSGVRRLSDFPR